MAIQIPLDRLEDNPWQTRQSYDEEYIERLADDIERNGLLQTPVGRLSCKADDFFLDSQTEINRLLSEGAVVELAFGHSRLRAFRQLGWETMPLELRLLTDEQMADFAWSENQQRKDLSPVEEAHAIEHRMTSFDWTQTQVAEHLGLDRSTVSNKLRLLKLPEEVLGYVQHGKLTERQASALVPAYDLSEEAEHLLTAIAIQGLYPVSTDPRSPILRDALEGEPSSRLRERVGRLMKAVEAARWQSRYLPPVLFVAGDDLSALIRIANPGAVYGSRHGDPKVSGLATVGPHRLVITASQWSNQGGEAAHAHEALTADEFASRTDNPSGGDEHLDYGGTFRFNRATYHLGYRCKIVCRDGHDPLTTAILSAESRPEMAREDTLDAPDETDQPGRIEHLATAGEIDVKQAGGEEDSKTDTYFIAYDARDQIIWGAGETRDDAIREYDEYTRGMDAQKSLRVVPASRILVDELDRNGGNISWHIREDGLAVPGAAGVIAQEESETPSPSSTWPEPRLDPVWDELPKMTKAKLEAVVGRLGRVALWRKYGPQWYASAKKDEMLTYVERLIRWHANLEAAHLLTDGQADDLLAWMRSRFEGNVHGWDLHDEDLRASCLMYQGIVDVERVGIMEEEALRRFRLSEARRAGAFCYHLFLADVCAQTPESEAALSLDALRTRHIALLDALRAQYELLTGSPEITRATSYELGTHVQAAVRSIKLLRKDVRYAKDKAGIADFDIIDSLRELDRDLQRNHESLKDALAPLAEPV